MHGMIFRGDAREKDICNIIWMGKRVCSQDGGMSSRYVGRVIGKKEEIESINKSST
jgi:hypothetical protein